MNYFLHYEKNLKEYVIEAEDELFHEDFDEFIKDNVILKSDYFRESEIFAHDNLADSIVLDTIMEYHPHSRRLEIAINMYDTCGAFSHVFDQFKNKGE